MVRKDRSNKKFISFSGPSCSGKTTLIDTVNWSDYFDNYKLVESHTRALKAKGMNINEKGSDETQVSVMDIHDANFARYNMHSNKSNFRVSRIRKLKIM